MVFRGVIVGALVGALVGGCVVLPNNTVTRTHVDTRFGPDVPEVGTLELALDSSYATIAVRASWRRACGRTKFAVYEVRTTTGLEVEAFGIDDLDHELMLVLWLGASLVTLPVSTAVSLVVHAVSGDKTRWSVEPAGTVARECPVVAAGLPVTLVLPSGATLEATTNAHGSAVFTISASEPAHGMVAIAVNRSVRPQGRGIGQVRRYAVAGNAPTTIEIADGAATLRELSRSCRVLHPAPAGVLKLTIDANGMARSISYDLGAREAAHCIGLRLVEARFPPRLRGHVVTL